MKKQRDTKKISYIQHLKDNPKGYWFKRKLYGWGWVPVKWQGWLVTLILIAFVVYMAIAFLTKGKLIEYFISLIIAIAILIYIAYKTGEKPKWSWGR
ncbi:MAG: hypothetical protein WC438_05225 [Candidatus Pacearchaeota archaeon]